MEIIKTSELPEGLKVSDYHREVARYFIRANVFGRDYYVPVIDDMERLFGAESVEGKIGDFKEGLALHDILQIIIASTYDQMKDIIGAEVHAELAKKIKEKFWKFFDQGLSGIIDDYDNKVYQEPRSEDLDFRDPDVVMRIRQKKWEYYLDFEVSVEGKPRLFNRGKVVDVKLDENGKGLLQVEFSDGSVAVNVKEERVTKVCCSTCVREMVSSFSCEVYLQGNCPSYEKWESQKENDGHKEKIEKQASKEKDCDHYFGEVDGGECEKCNKTWAEIADENFDKEKRKKQASKDS